MRVGSEREMILTGYADAGVTAVGHARARTHARTQGGTFFFEKKKVGHARARTHARTDERWDTHAHARTHARSNTGGQSWYLSVHQNFF